MKSEPEERLLDIIFILSFFKAVMCFIYFDAQPVSVNRSCLRNNYS